MRSRMFVWLAICLGACWSALLSAAPLAMAAENGSVAEVGPESAELTIANRSIVVFRATLLGETPAARVKAAHAAIVEALDENQDLKVSIDSIESSYMVLLADRRAFIITPKDLAPEDGFVGLAAERAAQKLRLVVTESQQARSLRFMLVATALSGLATLIYAVLLRAAYWTRGRLLTLLPKLMLRHADTLKIGQTPMFDTSFLYPSVRRLLGFVYWVLVLLFSYEWLSFVLSRFPYTRPWGESLNTYLLELARYLLDGIVGAIPGLAVALAIFFIAHAVSRFSHRLLERLSRPGTISWLNEETLQPTTRLTSLAIWLFAVAMAYPYLPGSGTDAFKGLSVLLGLMISLGASSVVGQAAAGLILTYTRTLRPGEFVRIGEHEGTVTEMGMFTTRIRTGLGEVLTIPNAMITGSVTKNYSRTVQGAGYMVDTTVTIGYDTPWRQVEAMLLEAARRTTGILSKPLPQVFQIALSDFYPEYRLVAQASPSEPLSRAQLLSMLHANIQDVFNEYGVQIMSPHYLGDPQQEKSVPKARWYAPPAQPPQEP